MVRSEGTTYKKAVWQCEGRSVRIFEGSRVAGARRAREITITESGSRGVPS